MDVQVRSGSTAAQEVTGNNEVPPWISPWSVDPSTTPYHLKLATLL